MAETILEAMGFPTELGFGWPELGMFFAAIASSLSVYFSTDTHGYITPGYRVPFADLPRTAKLKVYSSIACWIGFLAVFLSSIDG